MKTIFAIAIASVVSLASCGRGDAKSSVNSAVAPTKLAFSVDHRPVDGLLTTVLFEKGRDLKWNVTLNGKSAFGGNSTKSLGEDMTCAITMINAGSAVSGIECKHDLRPVDGVLNQIVVKLNSDGSYKVSQIVIGYDRRKGKEITTTNVIANGMHRTLPSIPVIR